MVSLACIHLSICMNLYGAPIHIFGPRGGEEVSIKSYNLFCKYQEVKCGRKIKFAHCIKGV